MLTSTHPEASTIISPVLPKELGSRGSHLDEPAGQTLPLNHRGHGGQTVPLHQSARHSRRGAALPRRDDDAEAVVSTAAHGSAPGVYHEADQEAERKQEIHARMRRQYCPVQSNSAPLSGEKADGKALFGLNSL